MEEERQEQVVIMNRMLRTQLRNFKTISSLPSSLTTPQLESLVKREQLQVKGSRAFQLHNFLSEDECHWLIEEAERLDFSDLLGQFPQDYRSNERLLVLSEELAQSLWQRLEKCLTLKDLLRIRPIGFGNTGTWKPFRLNECLKFARYRPGAHFSPHIDGPWVPREDECSIFTFLIYLNGKSSKLPSLSGGETDFLECPTTSSPILSSQIPKQANPQDILCTVSPHAGTALVFNHDTLHQGRPVTSGVKYLLRTELMFQRVDSNMLPPSIRLGYQTEPGYQKVEYLYQKSNELEYIGDAQGFTDTYLEALAIECKKQRSLNENSDALLQKSSTLRTASNISALPYELFRQIFSCLTPKEVAGLMRVCKDWYDLAMDGALWRGFFLERWPLGGDQWERAGCKSVDPFLKNWFGLYRQKHYVQTNFAPIVFDCGSFSWKSLLLFPHPHRSSKLSDAKEERTWATSSAKWEEARSIDKGYLIPIGYCYTPGAVVDITPAVLSRDFVVQEIENIVADVPGRSDLHYRREQYDRYWCGADAKKNTQHKGPADLVRPIHAGNIASAKHFPEIFCAMYVRFQTQPWAHPVLLCEPPFGWSEAERTRARFVLTEIYKAPSVCIANAASLALFDRDGRRNGVVVSLGFQVGCVTPVSEGCALTDEALQFQIASPTDSRDQISKMFSTIFANLQTVLAKHHSDDISKTVVLSGGGWKRQDFVDEFKRRCESQNLTFKLVYDSHLGPNYDVISGGAKLCSSLLFDQESVPRKVYMEGSERLLYGDYEIYAETPKLFSNFFYHEIKWTSDQLIRPTRTLEVKDGKVISSISKRYFGYDSPLKLTAIVQETAHFASRDKWSYWSSLSAEIDMSILVENPSGVPIEAIIPCDGGVFKEKVQKLTDVDLEKLYDAGMPEPLSEFSVRGHQQERLETVFLRKWTLYFQDHTSPAVGFVAAAVRVPKANDLIVLAPFLAYWEK